MWRKGKDPLCSLSMQEEDRQAELLTAFLMDMAGEKSSIKLNVPALKRVTEDRGYCEAEVEYARKKLEEHGIRLKPPSQGGAPNKTQLQRNYRTAQVSHETYNDVFESLTEEIKQQFLDILESDEQYIECRNNRLIFLEERVFRR